jgi:hypothetical protein
MKDMEKELKLKLLEQLMEEMDEAALKSKLPKEKAMMEDKPEVIEEPMAKIVEEKVVPLDEAKEEVMEKLEEAQSEESEMEDEDEDYGSDLLRRIKEAKKKKLLEQK